MVENGEEQVDGLDFLSEDAPFHAEYADEAAESPTEEIAQDSEEAGDEEAEASSAPDPLVKVMLGLAVALIAILLGTTLALVFYLNSLNKAPRTVSERDITTWEANVRSEPKDPNSWAALAAAYSQAGQNDDALAAIRRGIELTEEPVLYSVEADVLRKAGKYKESLAVYNKAEKAIDAKLKKVAREQAKIGVRVPKDQTGYINVYIGRAASMAELGDTKGALAQLAKAQKAAPRDVAIMVAMGDAYAKQGQNDKAKAQYTKALQLVPDYVEAIDGLKRIGKEQ